MKRFLIFILCLLQNCRCFLKPNFLHFPSLQRLNIQKEEKDSSSQSSFRDFQGLPSWLVQRCEELGFTTPTEAQRLGLPLILEGNGKYMFFINYFYIFLI